MMGRFACHRGYMYHTTMGWVWLGVCRSADVTLLRRLSSFGIVVSGKSAELGARGFP